LADYNFPEELAYSSEDEWVRKEADRAVLGVTDYAQDQLGDIVFVELPEPGATIAKGQTFGVIESVKAVSDLYAPISGKVAAVNTELEERPELVNEDCYGGGWIIAISEANAEDLDSLLDAASYRRRVDERSE
jgi:glycine cleavage system H protein